MLQHETVKAIKRKRSSNDRIIFKLGDVNIGKGESRGQSKTLLAWRWRSGVLVVGGGRIVAVCVTGRRDRSDVVGDRDASDDRRTMLLPLRSVDVRACEACPARAARRPWSTSIATFGQRKKALHCGSFVAGGRGLTRRRTVVRLLCDCLRRRTTLRPRRPLHTLGR